MNELNQRMRDAVGKVVVGQDDAATWILAATVLGGHVLLEGPPGVAKTLLAKAYARALGLDFARIQFTPDMLPSDATGTMTLSGGELTFRKGPIFTNVLLADEINRTPPKTQSALLEAMQEHQVTADGVTHPLPDPFVVLATQNPIEQEGTYPLPEAQLDRFLFKLHIDYPSEEAEKAILKQRRIGLDPTPLDEVDPVTTANELLDLRRQVAETTVSEDVLEYLASLVRHTRSLPSVELGASPRSSVHLLGASKACARLGGRDFVTPDDIATVAPIVLGHRLIMSPEADLDRYRPLDAVNATLGSVPVPR